MEEAQFLFSWRNTDSKQTPTDRCSVTICGKYCKRKERREKNQGTKLRLEVLEEQCLPSFVTLEQPPDVAGCAHPPEEGRVFTLKRCVIPFHLCGQMHRCSAQLTSPCFPFKGKEEKKKSWLFLLCFSIEFLLYVW